MNINWADLEQRSTPIDVCIVGGGAAGLTLANALRGGGLSVLVLEAGGLKQTRRAQRIYEGELVDPKTHPWLHHFRVRAIGGASRIWGGRCIPYDPIDFESRPWAPGPGWPIGLETLTPFYLAAQEAAEAGAFDYDPASALPGEQAAMVPGLDGPVIETRLERFSRPTDRRRKSRKPRHQRPHRLLVATAIETSRTGMLALQARTSHAAAPPFTRKAAK